jgi:hypothetical protein
VSALNVVNIFLFFFTGRRTDACHFVNDGEVDIHTLVDDQCPLLSLLFSKDETVVAIFYINWFWRAFQPSALWLRRSVASQFVCNMVRSFMWLGA